MDECRKYENADTHAHTDYVPSINDMFFLLRFVALAASEMDVVMADSFLLRSWCSHGYVVCQ